METTREKIKGGLKVDLKAGHGCLKVEKINESRTTERKAVQEEMKAELKEPTEASLQNRV